MIYQFYIFNRHCNPVFFYSQSNQQLNIEDSKLVYGVVFSLRNIITKVATEKHDGYFTFQCSQYRLCYFETPTVKFVIFCNPEQANGRDVLMKCYDIYVEHVVKNPLIPFDSPDINNDLFKSQLLKYIRAVP